MITESYTYKSHHLSRRFSSEISYVKTRLHFKMPTHNFIPICLKAVVFCHNLEMRHSYYYRLKKENVQESLHIDTFFFSFYFINKYIRILIKEVNLWFWVLIANPHNRKTINSKKNQTKTTQKLNIENCSLFNVAQSLLLMISNNYKVNEQIK